MGLGSRRTVPYLNAQCGFCLHFSPMRSSGRDDVTKAAFPGGIVHMLGMNYWLRLLRKDIPCGQWAR